MENWTIIYQNKKYFINSWNINSRCSTLRVYQWDIKTEESYQKNYCFFGENLEDCRNQFMKAKIFEGNCFEEISNELIIDLIFQKEIV